MQGQWGRNHFPAHDSSSHQSNTPNKNPLRCTASAGGGSCCFVIFSKGTQLCRKHREHHFGVHLCAQPLQGGICQTYRLPRLCALHRGAGTAAQTSCCHGAKIGQQGGCGGFILFVSGKQHGGGVAVPGGGSAGKFQRLFHLCSAGFVPGDRQHRADMTIEQLTVECGCFFIHPLRRAVAGAVGGGHRCHRKADAAAADSGQHTGQRIRREQEQHPLRRLFHDLEQGVGGFLVHALHMIQKHRTPLGGKAGVENFAAHGGDLTHQILSAAAHTGHRDGLPHDARFHPTAAAVAGLTYGRVRAMLDPKGRAVTEAGPSDAVEILGLQSVPNAGDEFRVFEDEREARALADERSLKARIEEQSRVKHVTLENLFETIADAEVKELNLIIKADVQGSIEALQDSLDKMDQSEVRINTIHSAVGAINETDVVLADASNAIIIGFGVRPDGKARSAAEREGVEIRCYDVIYKCLEELDAARIGMLKPTEVEVSTGTATVLDTFKVPKVGIAAGVRVEEGEIAATDSVRLVRDGIVVFNGKIASMRHYKDEAKSLKSGSEGGIGLENFQDIKPGDQIEGYRIDQVARTE